MKKVSRRALLVVPLSLVLILGILLFTVSWAVNGRSWILFPGSPHVYQDGLISYGDIVDRSGELLLRYHGQKTYSADAALRQATLHLLGDRSGNIPALFTEEYTQYMTGYDTVEGLYGVEQPVLKLTVSASVQKAAMEAMDGRKGAVAVYNYKTGQILCAVSLPTYDPDHMPDISADLTGAYDGVYVNRVFHATYVPGSIFKLVTTVAALETVPDILERTYTCQGEMHFGIDKVVCAGEHDRVDLKTALAKSCNCAFAQIALDVGAENLQIYAEKLGLTESFRFDGITTRAGQFDLSVDADVNVAWAGIGQYTNLVSPYAFLRFVGSIAGGGRGAEPYLVESAGSYSAQQRFTPEFMSPQTARTMQELMANNVQTIYGAYNFPDLSVCAKSGTAEVGGGLQPHATFAGFCLREDYPLAFFVAVENGGAGSAVCTPIVSRVLQACMESMEK